MKILSAHYANELHTAAVVQTEDDGDVVLSNVDTPDLWAELHSWGEPSVFELPVEPVPMSITPLQARKQLRALGIKAQADAYLSTCPDEVQEEWDFCIAVERSNPFLHGAAVAMVGEEQAEAWLDEFFVNASKIV